MAAMAHPYLILLRDREVSVLWAGLATSALGSELYRVGAIWLAVGLAGGEASFLVAAASAATLIMSLLGGAFADLVPRRIMIISANLASAAACLVVVGAALAFGLTMPVLTAASVVLAALAALATPALISGLPRLVAQPERLRATNGLFDATSRTAQVAGPFLAAGWIAVAPALHLLTANAVSFLASAGAVLWIGRRLDSARAGGGKSRILARLARGVSAANGCAGAWHVLATTGVRGGAYTLGFTVGAPLLLAETAGHDAGGLAGVALVYGAAAAGELSANMVVVTRQPKRPWRLLFAGYSVIALGIAFLPLPTLVLPPPLAIPCMALLAFGIGLGGGMAGVQMLTFFSSRLEPDDFAAVLRLRQAIVIAAAMTATAAGPFLFAWLGTAGTIAACGTAATAAALLGLLSRTGRRQDAAAAPVPAQ